MLRGVTRVFLLEQDTVKFESAIYTNSRTIGKARYVWYGYFRKT